MPKSSYALGMKAFEDEDYLAAIEEFKVVSLQYQGSNVADSAQFYMAESRYLREEYILAAFEYDVLLRTMPSSVFVSRARFRRATCFYELSPKSYLDQNYSRKAIDEYQAFLEYHPTDTLASLAEQRINELNTKLAKKDYENGITYMHMEYYKAATYYFDLVLEKYHDTQYAEPALLKKAEALTNRKKYADAKEAVDKFCAKYPTSVLKSDADQLRADIELKMIEDKTTETKKTGTDERHKQASASIWKLICDEREVKPVKASQVEMTELVIPNDTNRLGNLLGGRLMHWIDIAAAIAASRHTNRVCVTASVDELHFHHPVKQGEVVILQASVNRVFRTSLEVGVRVTKENPLTGERKHTNTAYLTFVAIDE